MEYKQIPSLIRSILSKRSIKGVLAITAGTIFGQVFVALLTPLVSRIYPPSSFGDFATLTAIASTVGALSTLKLDVAILLPDDESNAKGVMLLSILATLFTSLLVFFISFFLGPKLFPDIWDLPLLTSTLLSIMTLSTGLFTSFVAGVLRTQQFGLVGWRSAIQSIGTGISQIIFGLLGATSLGLIWGSIFGRFLGYGALFKGLRPIYEAKLGDSPWKLLVRYWRFPLIIAPSNFMNTAGTQLPLILVAAIFGSSDAGQLGMAQRLVFLPAALVGGAVAQVISSEMARNLRENNHQNTSLYLQASKFLCLLAVPIFMVFFFAGPPLMPWILGSSWTTSGALVQAMAITISLGIIVSPLSTVFDVYQSYSSLIIDGSRILLIGCATLVIFNQELQFIPAVWLLYNALTLNYLVTWIIGLSIVKKTNSQRKNKFFSF